MRSDLEPELLLNRSDPVKKFSQPMGPCDLPLRFSQRDGRRTEPRTAGKVLRNAALRRNDCAVADFEMTDNTDLASHHDIGSDPSASGNAGLRGDDRIRPDDDVVRDLHEIVDLDALLDPGPAEARPI